MIDALTLHRLLVESGTQHEIVHLARAISSADQLPVVLRLPRSRCLAVRMYDVGGVLTAVIVHAGSLPLTEALCEATGACLVAPACDDQVNSATGYAAELVSPLALPDSVELYADQEVVSGIDTDVVVYMATGESGTALGVRLLDLFTLFEAKIAALTHSLPPAPGTSPAGRAGARRA
jgi:Cys-tRNA(Pro)/Cys-tRNA(Cys) deacylase